jgi:hypothetical protein
MALPISPVTMPATLDGKENGKLPVSVLAPIGVGSALMEVTAARAFRAMFAAARRDLGVVIREVGDYRSFEGQVSLFVSRYKPVAKSAYDATASAHRKIWHDAARYGYSSIYWVKKDNNLATAAEPGTSNHGWGLALDIAEEYDIDPDPDGITQRFVNWLIAHAASFGISAELQSEAWHWRYCTGDALPAAVLTHEAGTNPPPPPPPPGDDDMTPLARPERAYDSRPGEQALVDPVLGDANKAVPRTPFAAGETRGIVIGFTNQVFVSVTAIGDTPGFVEASGTADKPTTSLTNIDPDGLTSGGGPVLTPEGKVYVYASAPCDVIVDVRARK